LASPDAADSRAKIRGLFIRHLPRHAAFLRGCMRAFRWLGPLVCVGVLAAVAMTGASSTQAPIPLPAALQHRHDPAKIKQRRTDGVSESSNWSGYAVTTSSINEVDGSWTVPALQSGSCVAGNDQYSSFWVGIDGFNSNTVEQTGTDSDCVNGVATYYAWYEFYPHPAFYAGPTLMTIHPGDTITAKVTYDSKRTGYTVTITDSNIKKGSFSTSFKMNAKQSSAEWIAEAPSSSGGVLSIANFGTMHFTNSHAGRTNNNPGSIASFFEPSCNKSIACSNVVQEITMVQDNGAGAQPTALDSNGLGFSDSYVAPTSGATKKGSNK
jgi:hypothetical protein